MKTEKRILKLTGRIVELLGLLSTADDLNHPICQRLRNRIAAARDERALLIEKTKPENQS